LVARADEGVETSVRSRANEEGPRAEKDGPKETGEPLDAPCGNERGRDEEEVERVDQR
jgi:hypothetical protein